MNGPLFGQSNLYTEKFSHSFNKEVGAYIERCHLEDGGYFFARVLPSSGLDTFFAIKGMLILGIEPSRPEATVSFITDDINRGTLTGMTGIFLTIEVLNDLTQLSDDVKAYALPRIIALQNRAGGFGAYQDVDVEVPSELQETYRGVKVLKTIGAEFDEQKVSRFVARTLNSDGGYGGKGYSTLASTFYATEIYKLLGMRPAKPSTTMDYLRKREENWQVQFIEDVYWLVGSLVNTGEPIKYAERISRFVLGCRRPNNGFSRATIMGIPTLEYTYYALSILKNIGVLG